MSQLSQNHAHSSTTQRGLQRIELAGDTYEAGTAPERQYKRVALDEGLSPPKSPPLSTTGQSQDDAIVIHDSPERVHKPPFRAFREADTASQLAETDPFSVSGISQLEQLWVELSDDEYS